MGLYYYALADFLLNTKLDLLTNCPVTTQRLLGGCMRNLVQICKKNYGWFLETNKRAESDRLKLITSKMDDPYSTVYSTAQ